MATAIPSPAPAPLIQPLADLRATLLRHYLRLSTLSRRLRFLTPASDAGLRALAANATPDRVIALRLDGEIRGILELFRSGSHAEIGISIEDAYQGQGHGRHLFDAGLREARSLGVKTADLFYSRENKGIHHLVETAGGTVRFIDQECEASIDLARLPAA